MCVCACASTACVRAPARTRAHGACVQRERERDLGRETYIHVHQHTWNCPWMSPTTVTGDEMRGMLGASIRISLQRRHSCVTSSSSSGSSAQQRSKHSSRSSISLGAHRQNRLLLRRGISSTGWAPRRAYAYGHTGGKGEDCVRSACVARVAGPLSPRQRGGQGRASTRARGRQFHAASAEMRLLQDLQRISGIMCRTHSISAPQTWRDQLGRPLRRAFLTCGPFRGRRFFILISNFGSVPRRT